MYLSRSPLCLCFSLFPSFPFVFQSVSLPHTFSIALSHHPFLYLYHFISLLSLSVCHRIVFLSLVPITTISPCIPPPRLLLFPTPSSLLISLSLCRISPQYFSSYFSIPLSHFSYILLFLSLYPSVAFLLSTSLVFSSPFPPPFRSSLALSLTTLLLSHPLSLSSHHISSCLSIACSISRHHLCSYLMLPTRRKEITNQSIQFSSHLPPYRSLSLSYFPFFSRSLQYLSFSLTICLCCEAFAQLPPRYTQTRRDLIAMSKCCKQRRKRRKYTQEA